MDEADWRVAPLSCIRENTVEVLSRGLDHRKVLPTSGGVNRDWRGLAAKSALPTPLITSCSSDKSPTRALLAAWRHQHLHLANVQLLADSLAFIDRYDVLEDASPLLKADVEYYLNKTNRISDTNGNSYSSESKFEDDIRTIKDLSLTENGFDSTRNYDAFVLYADEDTDFAVDLITRMENCGFSLCVKDRDFIGGLTSEHAAVLHLISNARTRLIVILSPAFLTSPAHAFFIEYAQALGIEQRRRKIIPCVYKDCKLPLPLSFYFLLHYERSGPLWNFWDKLRDSLKVTPQTLTEVQRGAIRAIEYNTSTLMANSVPNCVPQIEYNVNSNLSTNSMTIPQILVSAVEPVITGSVTSRELMSSSMIELNGNADVSSTSSRSTVSMSVNNLSNVTMDEQPLRNGRHKKKNKWYKIFKFKSSNNLELCNMDPNANKKTKQNKKWNWKRPLSAN
ncbi:myeloid differentiation primary response protein MyD88 [Arctopsyche grandis]|uniref:myeloid differentiation primary response protein MyD88 n=1 Tax=Arctopsyche grandis TaxID=121162 RepID=UPI00406D654D